MPATFTTSLPDEDQPALGNGVEDEIAVDRESAPTNYGSVRIQIRETGASSWDSSAAGFHEFIGAFDTLSMEFVGREDGEEYEVRARTETEHVTGAWTAPVSITTKFPGATGLSVTVTGATSTDLDWTDNADNETAQRILRAAEHDPLRDRTIGELEVIDEVGPDVESFTDTGLDPNRRYRYQVEPYTEHASARSNTDTVTTDIAIPDDGWFFVFEDDAGDYATIDHDAVTGPSPMIDPQESGKGRWTVDIPPEPALRQWLGGDVTLYYDGEFWLRGIYTRYHPNGGRDAAAQLEGLDVMALLDRGGVTFDVTSEQGFEAVGRFVDENLPEWTIDITPPTEATIAEDWLIQDVSGGGDLESLFGLDATDSTSRWIRDGDELRVAQQSFTRPAGTADRNTGFFFESGVADAVNGELFGIGGSGHSLEFDESIDHAIPQEHVGFRLRVHNADPDGVHATEFAIVVNGSETTLGTLEAGSQPLEWFDVVDEFGYDPETDETAYGGPDLAPGDDVTFIVRADGDSPGTFAFDVATVYDRRAEGDLTWATSLNANDQLPGPEFFAPVTETADPFEQTYNVTAAEVSATLNDTSNGQRLQATNDGGETWLPDDGSEGNTTTATADFGAAESFGTSVQGRATLDGHGEDPSSTPTQGRQPQRLSGWELRLTTNAIRVIDDQTFSGSPFAVLDELTNAAGLNLLPDYREEQLALQAFEPGGKVRDLRDDWTVIDDDPVDTVEGYFNSIRVFGPENDDGERLVATAASSAEIEARGEIEGPAKFRPEASTEAELTSIARSVLADGIAQDTISGSVEIESQFVLPGVAFRVDEFEEFDPRDDLAYVLQRAKFSFGTMSLDFEGRSLVDAIRSIETEVSTVKRAL